MGTEARRAANEDQQLHWLQQLVAQAQIRRFFGRIIVVVQDGQITQVVKEESLKPPA